MKRGVAMGIFIFFAVLMIWVGIAAFAYDLTGIGIVCLLLAAEFIYFVLYLRFHNPWRHWLRRYLRGLEHIHFIGVDFNE